MSDFANNSRSAGGIDRLVKGWPLALFLFVLCALFAWVFIASVDQAKEAKARELSLESNPPLPYQSVNLELSTELESRPGAPTAAPGSPKPAPWWPVLLFALAFSGGWCYRHAQRLSKDVGPASDVHPEAAEAEAADPAEMPTSPVTGKASTSDEHIPTTDLEAQPVPDLAKDFPWDESVLDDTLNLSREERIALLENQNASKAEIIKALEELVAENREKWLHQDETEARLSSRISELSADLKMAVRQLQQLRGDAHASPPTSRENTA